MYLAWTIVALHWSMPKGDVAPKLFEKPCAVCSSSTLLCLRNGFVLQPFTSVELHSFFEIELIIHCAVLV